MFLSKKLLLQKIGSLENDFGIQKQKINDIENNFNNIINISDVISKSNELSDFCIFKAKNNELLFSCFSAYYKSESFDLNVYLFNQPNHYFNPHRSIFRVLLCNEKLFVNDKFIKSLKIQDIYSPDDLYKNQGIGTICINNIKKLCLKNGYSSIIGWISQVDVKHHDRLLHFYEKNGFNITETSKDNYDIELIF